jgi:hypothetical protein
MANAFEGVQGLEIDAAELKLEYILQYLNTPRVLCEYISRCCLLKSLLDFTVLICADSCRIREHLVVQSH